MQACSELNLKHGVILRAFAWGCSALVLFGVGEIRAQAIVSPDIPYSVRMPAHHAWFDDIRQYPVAPNSAALIASIGAQTGLHPDFGTVWQGAPMGIPYIVVDAKTPKARIVFTDYGDESDPGPYPIPLDAPIEGGPASNGDRHVLAVDTSARILYELYRAFPKADHWEAGCGAVWNLQTGASRPEGWTSADAAGLAILPGLVRYQEVRDGAINHAIRMTVPRSQRAYLFPATHQAGSSTSADLPAMGQRFRLRADFEMSSFPKSAQVILKAMQIHGLIVADNGSPWYFSGAPDARWNDEELNTLKRVRGSDFVAVASLDANGKPIRSASLQSPRLRRKGNHIQSLHILWKANGVIQSPPLRLPMFKS